MGQKVNPIGFRLGYIRDWQSSYYADVGSKQYKTWLQHDLIIRDSIKKNFKSSLISSVIIKRKPEILDVEIHATRISSIVGKPDVLERVSKSLSKIVGKLNINVVEVKKPDLDANIVAKNIVAQLEKRMAFKRVIKKAIASTMRSRALGIKVICSGRLSGAEIARSEQYMEGRVPLHTLRAYIDYAPNTAMMQYGTIGVKVWIYRGIAANKTEGRKGVVSED